jgi:hypothetical protein
MVISNVSAVPRFGMAGQGTPVWSAEGLSCNPGYKWCIATILAKANQIDKNALAFEAQSDGTLTVTADNSFVEKFSQMISNDVLVIEQKVLLDEELSRLLMGDLKQKRKGSIALKPGKYKISRLKGRIQISNVMVDYVGHVTLLR